MLSSLQLKFVKRKLWERVKGKEVGRLYDSERTEKRSGGKGPSYNHTKGTRSSTRNKRLPQAVKSLDFRRNNKSPHDIRVGELKVKGNFVFSKVTI